MIQVAYIMHDASGQQTLDYISDRVEFLTGKEIETFLVSTSTLLTDFLSSEGASFILVDNFFNQEENADLKIVPALREKFPQSKIVSFSMFPPTNTSIYDLVLGIGKNRNDLYRKLCVEISCLVKPA